jgi:NADPH:quinone reductase-like Zn-dependent oxidoreductase
MATMKAVRIHEFGGPDVLSYEQAPVPTIGEDEVLIRGHAAGVNRVDAIIRAGYMAEYINHNLPLTHW